MSAIVDSDAPPEVVKVLFALHQGFDTLDFAGPFEVFQNARHEDKVTKAFKCFTAGDGDGKSKLVTSSQGAKIEPDMDFEDATEDLEDFDVLVILGGATDKVVDASAEPIPLIKAWAKLQEKDPSRERTLFSVCTGSLFLAKAGVLQGLSATTHYDYYTTLENLAQAAAQADTGVGTDVQEERYVVNNARFDLGDIKENPFIFQKNPPPRSAASVKARRGSEAFKQARRRESLVKRAEQPLGGLRVITSGGVTAGIDATLYLIAAFVSIKEAERVANRVEYTWKKGVCVDAIDV